MKRVLLISPSFHEPGGGTCVAAWALQGLFEAGCAITLLSWDQPDMAVMNERFGTTVPDGAAAVVRVPPTPRCLVEALPFRLALLRRGIIEGEARRLLASSPFDLVISAANEMNVGRPMIQYVHFPWAAFPRPEHDLRWFHFAPLVRLYRGLVIGAYGDSRGGVGQNLTLVNSQWTGGYFERWYDAPCTVLFPPAPVPAAGGAWEARQDRFVCLGRFAPEKRIVEMIGVLRQVRARGFDISLDICGQIDSAAYYREVAAAARGAGDWVRLHLDLPRAALVELIAGSRYGIHGMIGEHFGIAIAEMIRLGCLCFANRDGGPAEILGDDRLLFDTDGEAVERICAMLGDPAGQADARDRLARRAERFSPQAFMRGFREACDLGTE